MNPDDRICYCYDVTLRKLQSFAERTRPARASQMSECLGAGTGCGWCIPILKRIFEQAGKPDPSAGPDLTPEEYANRRREYIESGRPKNTF